MLGGRFFCLYYKAQYKKLDYIRGRRERGEVYIYPLRRNRKWK